MLRETSLGHVEADVRAQLRDILSPKATSTLAKRAGPLLKFIAFCQAEKQDPLPLHEGGGL